MNHKIRHLMIYLFIILIFISSFNLNVLSLENKKRTDIESLSFKQELNIPIDTSLENTKNQPIDLHFDFENICWAKNETTHSVRVCYENSNGLNELESQIYDLEHTDESHISSCKLVFLIPEDADGNEKYFIYYDSKETESPNYKDHIKIQDTHYFYEPISGQVIEFDYYEVKEEDEVVYAVIQKGELLGNPVAQSVIKMKPGSLVVETYNIQQLCSFDIRYGIVQMPTYYGTGYATQINKYLLVDGNLMAKMRIEGQTPKGDLKTDNIYTYYYCPTKTKKIDVNVFHEVLKTIDIPEPDILDGTLSGMVSIKSRSSTIEKMNAGKILPSIAIYTERDKIEKYSVPPNPDSEEMEAILSTTDDIDLGSRGWISLGDPSTGEAHGLIMDRYKDLNSNEVDGVQIKAYVQQKIKLPGLEADTGNVFLLKNNYEKGGSQKTVLPEGYNVNFNVEFISIEDEGFEKIDPESEIFQTLIKSRPILRGNISDEDEEDKQRFEISASIHLAPSFPMGSLLSAALGRNFPYIYAELYKEGDFKSSGSVGRLPLGKIELELEGKSFFQIIKTIFGLFDWRNASLFKKIRFPDLDPGTYVVKIYRENLFFGRERKFIGFRIVELKKDESINIFCRPQASMKVSVLNQDSKGVENVKCLLLHDNVSIYDSFTDVNGTTELFAPCSFLNFYTLRIIYQGFLVEEKQIRFGYLNRLIPIKDNFLVEQNYFNLILRDKWSFSPEIEINPTLTSEQMVEPIVISAEYQGDGRYLFNDLYPGVYLLKASYKSFEIQKELVIMKKRSLELVFPAEYSLNINIFNSYAEKISDGRVFISRITYSISSEISEEGFVDFVVPPGDYELTVFFNDQRIAQQKVRIRGEKNIDIVSSKESGYHNIIIYLGIFLGVCSVIFMFFKKSINAGIKLFVIALLIIALFSSWWGVSGERNVVKTNTKTLLIPSKIVTITSSSEIMGGEISLVPEEVTMVLGLISAIVIFTCLLVFISIFLNKRLPKTNMFLSILCVIFLILSLFIFVYAMSEITKVSVGGFIGSGKIETTIPGLSETVSLPSYWGPETGFYLCICSLVIFGGYIVFSKIKSSSSNKWICFPRKFIKRWMVFDK